MDKTEAIQYIRGRNWRDSRLGLERIKELLQRLGNPHNEIKFVHVAGTNGKGSVCAMLASVLMEAGYKTGLFTSPFINEFNEYIQINGDSISDEDLSEITSQVKKEAEKLADHPTEFELITTIAFLYFLKMRCDIVVLEVGLGGRLDSTNIIPVPEVAVITPISYDHMAELGNTLEKIATEKAGIIKVGGIVVSSHQEPNIAELFRYYCRERHTAGITFVDLNELKIQQNTLNGQRFSYRNYKNMEISLLGNFQPQNAALVIAVVEQLKKKGWNIGENFLRRGLKKATWPARFEVVNKHPYVIVDGGHNLQCTDVLVESLRTYFPKQSIFFLIGVMADKEYKTMLNKVMPLAKKVFAVTINNRRALDGELIADYFSCQGVEALAFKSVKQGLHELMKVTGNDDTICVFGSLFMCGTVRKAFMLKTSQN